MYGMRAEETDTEENEESFGIKKFAVVPQPPYNYLATNLQTRHTTQFMHASCPPCANKLLYDLTQIKQA